MRSSAVSLWLRITHQCESCRKDEAEELWNLGSGLKFSLLHKNLKLDVVLFRKKVCMDFGRDFYLS